MYFFFGLLGPLLEDALGEAEAVVLRTLENVLHDLEGSGSTPEQLLEALLFSTHMPLSKDEIGAALGLSPRTVRTDWEYASGWLEHRLGIEGND